MSGDMNLNTIGNAVANIEGDIFDSTDGVEYFNISLITNGFCQIVEFCDIELWRSDEDCRLYLGEEFEEENREDIEICLRRRLNEEISKLKKIIV